MNTERFFTSRTAVIGYSIVALAAAVVIGALFVGPLLNAPKRQFADFNVGSDRIAIHGYDTVAYFTEGKPTKGKEEFEHTWEDAKWHFASATNRDLFKANPDRYAPQYGGYCALGLAAGEYADTDPNAFTIVDGKLYLNLSIEYRDGAWRKAPKAYLATADYNWSANRDTLRDNYKEQKH